MTGSPTLQKLVYVWVRFQILSGMSLPKPNLSIPREAETSALFLIHGKIPTQNMIKVLTCM